MKRRKEGEGVWPIANISCRKRDLVIRIADWTRTTDCPTFDVEVYIGGMYVQAEGGCFATRKEAALFASQQIKKLL